MAPGLSILLIEDNLELSRNLADFFALQGQRLDYARGGREGLRLALDGQYDVIILDLMLPDLSGLEVCRQLRAQQIRHTPVLMLTARDTLNDKLSGFSSGADDYLTKPFALDELYVRCQVLARRHLLHGNTLLRLGDLTIDRARHTATRAGRTLNLNPLCYRILLLLAQAYPAVVTRSELTQKIWGEDPPDSDVLRSHIYLLRKSLDKPFPRPMLSTVHGVGFRLEVVNGDSSVSEIP